MNLLRSLLLAAALAATPAWAQTGKTTEQQARSYILSAFMTGSAPAVLSADVKVSPPLRERLALAPDADSRAAYYALVRLTAGRSLTVRPAKIDELERTETQVEAGKPVFALDVSETTFVLAYDLERDLVTQVADASRPVAVTLPVAPQEPAQPIAQAAPTPAPTPTETPVEKPATEAAPPAPAVTAAPAAPAAAPPAAAEAAPPAPAAPAEPTPGARVQVVEPREPNFSKSAARAPALARPEALQTTREAPRLPPLKPNGACVVKPVMSDQDLVNCGARVR